jgi:transposase-like protein
MMSVARVVPASETEVSAKATRRRFSGSEKLRILREAEACARERGGVAALLRREGLYSSHLAAWRRQRDAGQLGPTARKRGPVAKVPDSRDKEIAVLERELRRANMRAERAERLVELQKKVSELLGIPLGDPDEKS